ncbi:Triacylglycerol lipase 1 [Dichanthelium oligosanthes]|uniref:Lipase n=1 Tax=Dichanthelium oligosanthes TaxID=888268 RepID=A0A1E5UNA6_9POAL|nr:Triacylglycerol lipase 1 [Dichanthelium oligosanthes]
MVGPGGALAAAPRLLLPLLFCFLAGDARASPATDALRHVSNRAAAGGLCEELLLPQGYLCTEHTVETDDGFLLSLQHIPHGKNGVTDNAGPPVFLQHGLFQGGDTWFINSNEQSLGYILADNGFDVWIGNVRGTRWSKGHSTLSVHDKLFWDWSWQDLAEYDLLAMLSYVYTVTQSKILYVGHSQGTIMGLAAFTKPEIVEMISSAALLCPISYLDHVSASFVLRAVAMHLDQMLITMGIHQLNFRSAAMINLSLLSGKIFIWFESHYERGQNCCFNSSRIDYYLEYEPHPSSTKNMRHLFQMIRKGTFAKYDYGWVGNIRCYGQLHPPPFDLSSIPESLPIWMGYGGLDALADVTDVERTIKELRSTPELLYIGDYGHIDFIMSVKAKDDVYVDLMRFLRAQQGMHSSY